ncbi:MAG: hypothetical protein P8Y29_01555 [Gemmatimonadota bacterium]
MKRPLHLYVHVPFCARKCPYCHFYNIGHDDGREALYVDGLAREIDTWRRVGVLAGYLATGPVALTVSRSERSPSMSNG